MTEGKISPHAGRELSLMLAGKKPAAMFGYEKDCPMDGREGDVFFAHVRAGTFVHRWHICPAWGVEHHYFSLPDETWRIAVLQMLAIDKSTDGRMLKWLGADAFFGLTGRLLGYSARDVDAYVAGRNGPC
ncbi:hypothetical protein FHW69_001147 [Luteibacter sp. Sphag1AF]|uniref:hypothetical protein n=1 Tax=Luteibacter sp. Sphag1AF TaxID=2587031 RepID=UPI00161C359D|nr:hypothetical protein [Luteibacter sp. Sphag1AF]MBB3226557.1 hypothetical protein [Luteibacter sp. Sphag1AF]